MALIDPPASKPGAAAPEPAPEEPEEAVLPEEDDAVDEPPAEDAPEDDDETSEEERLAPSLTEDDLRFLKRWPEADRELVLALSPELQPVMVERLRKFETGLDKRAQQAAQERSQQEAQLQQAMGQTQQMFAHLQQRSAQVDQALELMGTLQELGMAPQKPDVSMMQTDFIGYQEQLEKHTRFVEAAQGLLAEKQRLQQDAQAQEAAQKDTIIRSEAQRLTAAVPELQDADPERRSSFVRGMTDVMKSYGASAQELQNLHDHRIWKLAADLYRVQSNKALADAALARRGGAAPASAPGVQTTARPRGGAAQAQPQKAVAAAREQMRKTGDPADVASWLTASEKGAKRNGR